MSELSWVLASISESKTMGSWWGIGPYDKKCISCGATFEASAQFKTFVPGPCVNQRVGTAIDVLDGVYPGSSGSQCDSCYNKNPNSSSEWTEVIVRNGIVSIGNDREYSDPDNSDTFWSHRRPDDFLRPPPPREGGHSSSWPSLELVGDNDHAAVVSPFWAVSFEFLKQAVLYHDKVIIVENQYNLDDWRWSEMLTHNPLFYSYVQSAFGKSAKISHERILRYVFRSEDDYYSNDDETQIMDALCSFVKVVDDNFTSQTAILRDVGLLVSHRPRTNQKQFLYEWLHRYYDGAYDSSLLPHLANAICSRHFMVPTITDLPVAVVSTDTLETVFHSARGTRHTRHSEVRSLVDAFATESLSMNLPRLNVQSFEDVLYAREALSDELTEFREKMHEFGREVESSWDWIRLRTERVEDLLHTKCAAVLSNLEGKAREMKRQFARDVTFGIGKAGVKVDISVCFGLPNWARVLICGGSVSLKLVRLIVDQLSIESQTTSECNLSYHWKLDASLPR